MLCPEPTGKISSDRPVPENAEHRLRDNALWLYLRCAFKAIGSESGPECRFGGEGHGDIVEKLTYGQDVCHG